MSGTMQPLAGRSILVTGAARGLGAAIAFRLAQDGARLWIADVESTGGERVAREIRATGHEADFLSMDVSDEADVAAAAAVIAAGGPLYGLVNNAALADSVGGKLFDEISVREWDRLMAVNLRGPWLVSRAVLGPMRDAGEGRIINIASDAALFGSPRLAHYIASKSGVMGLTRAQSRELGQWGITANSVLPGLTETASTERVPRERHELYRTLRAIPRAQQPSDVVGLVAFLCSDDASYLTGQSLVIDGGFVLS